MGERWCNWVEQEITARVSLICSRALTSANFANALSPHSHLSESCISPPLRFLNWKDRLFLQYEASLPQSWLSSGRNCQMGLQTLAIRAWPLVSHVSVSLASRQCCHLVPNWSPTGCLLPYHLWSLLVCLFSLHHQPTVARTDTHATNCFQCFLKW